MGGGFEAPRGIFNSVTPDGLCRPGNVAPVGVAVFHSVNPSVGTLFVPLEVALRNDFLPALLGVMREEVYDSLRNRIT